MISWLERLNSKMVLGLAKCNDKIGFDTCCIMKGGGTSGEGVWITE